MRKITIRVISLIVFKWIYPIAMKRLICCPELSFCCHACKKKICLLNLFKKGHFLTQGVLLCHLGRMDRAQDMLEQTGENKA